MAARGNDFAATDSARRKENERLKAQAAAKAAAGARGPDTTGRTANWLKRETPFICDIRFRNDLPEVPCEPKMLVSQPNPKALAAFHLTTLESGPWRGLPMEADLGVPVSVFDTAPYCVPNTAQSLHPDDEALLEGEGHTSSIGTPGGLLRARGRTGGDKKELSWLMRTTYITNDMSPSLAKTSQARKKEQEEEEEEQDEVQRQIDYIQASFDLAKQPPRHQKNPNLQPLEVLPVLPDEELWANEYVQLVFDADPTAGMPQLRGLSAPQRRACAENAVTKSYRMTADGVNSGFLALMVPTEPPHHDIPPAEREPTEVQWVREYSYEVHQQEADRDFAFVFPKPVDVDTPTSAAAGREVRYAAMDHKLVAKGMGGRQQAQNLAATFSKPSRITVGWRALTEIEEDTRAAKRQQLMPISGDEDLFDEEGDDDADVAADAAYADVADASVSDQPSESDA